MKSTRLKFLAVALFFSLAGCNNDTEKKEEVKTVVPAENKQVVKEKEKTEISVGPGSAEVKTKDANVKILTRDTSK